MRGGCFEAADALAWAVPVRTVSRLLRLPMQDEPLLRAWLRAVIHRDAEDDLLPESARAASCELRAHLIDQIADRRRALGGAAVEELLRYESPVQYQVRTATRDVELHGVTIAAGDRGPRPRTRAKLAPQAFPCPSAGPPRD